VPFGRQIQEPGGLGRLPRVRFGEHPGAEPGHGGGGGHGQAKQPQEQAADDGQRGGRITGERGGRRVSWDGSRSYSFIKAQPVCVEQRAA
jgi:hypothetical protein